MTQQVLYIIAGANGSGKTSFALDFVRERTIDFINADELAKLINPNDIKKAQMKAGKLFFDHLNRHLIEQKTFAIESTLSGRYLIKVIETAKKLDFKIHLIYLYLVDPTLNIMRVKSRVQSGGHDVPKNDIIRRFYRSKRLFWDTYRQLCDGWELFYNANTFQLIAVGQHQDYEIFDNELMAEFLNGVKNDRQ